MSNKSNLEDFSLILYEATNDKCKFLCKIICMQTSYGPSLNKINFQCRLTFLSISLHNESDCNYAVGNIYTFHTCTMWTKQRQSYADRCDRMVSFHTPQLLTFLIIINLKNQYPKNSRTDILRTDILYASYPNLYQSF